MLSNKLTFSLVYLVFFAAVLAFIATPAVAQRVNEVPARADAGYTVGMDSGFFLIQTAANNGILIGSSDPERPIATYAAGPPATGNLATVATQTNVATSVGVPDLEDFFGRGGTIDVVVPIMGMYEQADDRWHDVVITEIMWGLDWRPAGATGTIEPHTDKQWIELYNNSGPVPAYKDVDARGEDRDRADVDGVKLLFTNNIYFGADASESPPKGGAAGFVGVFYGGAGNNELTYSWLNARPDDWDADAVPQASGTAPAEANLTGGDGAFIRAENATYAAVYKVIDRVSNLGRGGRTGPLPGQSGSTAKNIDITDVATETLGTVVDGTYVPLISAFRKRVLLLDDQTGIGTYHPSHTFGKGTDLGQWMSSWEEENAVRRRNIEDPYIGTPGAEHLTPKPPTKTVVPVGLVFNEVRNDTSEADIDWIELYNNGADAVALENVEITRVIADADPTDGADADPDFIKLPATDDDGEKIMLGAGEYLLIVNQEPEDSILADGKDITINASNRLKLEGATHLYYHPDTAWSLDGTQSLLILRGAADKNGTPDAILDVVGDLYITDLRDDFDTKVWPLRNWGAPAEGDDADPGSFGSQGRDSVTWARVKYEADNWWHKDHWVMHDYMGGIGYRKDLDHGIHEVAPGTPGYRNGTQGTLADFTKADAGGAVTISEIMYDAGAAWDLVQWIELYNNSMTESVDISDWTMDIRNARDDEEPDRSFVDADFEFDAGTIIAPNQTLLVVSATGATNVPANRVYDLYERHGNELGLKSRRAYLLSKVGFRIELYDDAVTPEMVDTAGNAYLDGASVITGEANPDDADDGGWALHEVSGEGEARHSMVRQYGGRYGTRDETAGYEAAKSGTMDGAWRKAGLESGNIGIFYGHTDDFSTPAFRRGGPLPVSLASFRPYRDKATGEVVVRWVTESELNNAGFNILRSETKTGQFKVINLKGLIQGQGTTSEKHVYSFIDKTAKPNVVYYYQIEDVSMDGQRTTLTTTHLRGNVTAANKLTTRWGELKSSD